MEHSTHFGTSLDSWRARRATVFGKWLMIYFWVQIFLKILTLISSLAILNGMPAVLLLLLTCGCSATEVVVFYQMGRQEDRFRTSAGLALIVLVAGIIMELPQCKAFADLLRIPRSIIATVAIYHFMIGCAEILMTTDGKLSEVWRGLWKWYIGLQVGTIVATPVLLILEEIVNNIYFTKLGLVLAIGAAIALFVIEFLWIVHLYQTAKCFREISKTLGSSHGNDVN